MATDGCCAECSEEGGVSLKTCKACMSVQYCSAECQRNHWPKHKKQCKQRAAELSDEALFKDPPPNDDCPICFLPMPRRLICCISLPPATILSVPIYDFAEANKELADVDTNGYYPCCGKNICGGCVYSCWKSGNNKCPFCNSDRSGKTDEEMVADMMKRVEANDAGATFSLGSYYHKGRGGLQQDHTKAMDLYVRAAELGLGKAHCNLGLLYHEGGDMKKAKFHLEAAAMAGHEVARYNLGVMECHCGNNERAVKHWTIAASAGDYKAMHHLITSFKRGQLSRDAINLTLKAYNNACAEMRSDARDARIKYMVNN
jgi:hypothetical protein